MLKKTLSLFLLACLAVPVAQAQKRDNPPPPPQVQGVQQDDEDLQPDVTIHNREDGRYEEFRVRGRLYMIRVTPRIGRPYYLIDQTGAGNFDRFDNPPGSALRVPHWVLMRW